MKRQVCVTLDEKSVAKIREKINGTRYRSKSHFIECAVEDYLKMGENKNG